MGFYSFMVLSSIGAALIALAYLRRLPARYLLVGALAVLALHPMLDVSALPTALRAILYEPVRTGVVRSLYPIIPWCAIVVVGYVAGRDAALHGPDVRRLAAARGRVRGCSSSSACPAATAMRTATKRCGPRVLDFREVPAGSGVPHLRVHVHLPGLAVLAQLARNGTPAWLRPFEVYGRVPFFFYIVHFYVLGVRQAMIRTRFGLLETYLIWLRCSR